jgi:hypothetical protein
LRRILRRPGTRPGWWSVALAAAFVVLFIIDLAVFLPSTAGWRQAVTPFYGIAMMSWGLVAGVVGLIAVIRRHERSWLVWLALLPGLLALATVLFEVFEVFIGHE